MRSVLLVSVVVMASAAASRAVEQIDWGLINNRVIAVIEVALMFGFFLARHRDRQDHSWSHQRVVVAPLVALVMLASLPAASNVLFRATGNPHIQAQMALERLPIMDPLAAIVGRLWMEQQPPGTEYYRAMTTSPIAQSQHQVTLPATTFASAAVEVSRPLPHVFIFVIDSLRRDYLSPYNRSVTFTPSIGSFAADSYVFANAFTAYGGTWMSIPSMWTGAPLTRSWGQLFRQMNAIEPLIKAGGYDFVVNEHSVQPMFTAPRTFINPTVPSVDTDLCDNVAAVREHIETRNEHDRPMFTYLAPMNVHILNTRSASRAPDDPRYAGFYHAYAAALERVDSCFGTFLTYLKDRGLYDNSIIIFTSDHGESLGSDGNWGHQFFLFPENVRIPMIIRLPEAIRERVTTDLERVAMLPDVAPTLLTLLGHQFADPGPAFFSTLFVPTDGEPSARRRESFLLMSSYGSTFGLLRRNGKFLYISDLVNWREYAYRLFKEPLGERIPVTETLRRVNRADIRTKVDGVEKLYRPQ